MSLIYTGGYQGRSVEHLRLTAEALNARVVDLRFRPESRSPEWSYKELAPAMVGRYHWFGSWWGNRHYKPEDREKGIEFADWEEGLVQWKRFLRNCAPASVILLCQCREVAFCHRWLIGERLRVLGHPVQSLDWLEPPKLQGPQIALF